MPAMVSLTARGAMLARGIAPPMRMTLLRPARPAPGVPAPSRLPARGTMLARADATPLPLPLPLLALATSLGESLTPKMLKRVLGLRSLAPSKPRPPRPTPPSLLPLPRPPAALPKLLALLFLALPAPAELAVLTIEVLTVRMRSADGAAEGRNAMSPPTPLPAMPTATERRFSAAAAARELTLRCKPSPPPSRQ